MREFLPRDPVDMENDGKEKVSSFQIVILPQLNYGTEFLLKTENPTITKFARFHRAWS
jgi:hypothetical protein